MISNPCKKQKKKKRAWGIAQWYGVCLACSRLWVLSPAQIKQMNEQTKPTDKREGQDHVNTEADIEVR